MKDSWIDKNEIDELLSGFSKEKQGSGQTPAPQPGAPEDIFDDIPAVPSPFNPATPPVSEPVQPAPQPPPQPMQQPMQQPAAHPSPLPNHSVPLSGRVVNSPAAGSPAVSQPTVIATKRGANFASPFSIDEEDDLEDIEDIEKLASEAAQALRALQDVRARAERGGLLVTGKESAQPAEEISTDPLDRIPLDLEIDLDQPLKKRLAELASILEQYVEMEEMTVVDQHGFALFQTEEIGLVKQNVVKFVDSIRKVYGSEKEARQYSASQLAVDDEKWLCIIPTDGDLEGRFLLKALLRKPLDRPEVYVVVELLNEVLRPEVDTEQSK